MRSERKKQVMTLSILLVAVLVISVGFAAFSATLKINTEAIINPNSTDFKVVFSNSSNSVDESDVTPTLTPDTISASDGEINNTTTPTLSNLSASFTKPGQKVVYNLYVYNAGEYDAYLNSVMLQGNKSCTPGEGAAVSLVGKACEDIIVIVKIGNESYTETTTNITGQTIAKGKSTPIEITIEYLSDGDRADGPFSVEFSDISLYYATIAGENEQYEGESGTLYTGIIYRHATDILYTEDTINNRWCAVSLELGNSCTYNDEEIFRIFSSKEQCESALEQEENPLLANATCEPGTLTYETNLANINANVYLKHEVVNNEVISSYACITYTENGVRKDVCLRGEDPSYFEANTAILRSVESYFNTLSSSSSHNNYKGYCDFFDSYSYCDSDSLYLFANSGGGVNAFGGSSNCNVYSDGYSHCS